MTASALTHQIARDLELMGTAIACNDVDAIEAKATCVSASLCELRNALTGHERLSQHDLQPISCAAKRCSILLKRAQLALSILQNLHQMFSDEQNYQVRR